MRELIQDSFYEMLREYDGLVVDYCLVEEDCPEQGDSPVQLDSPSPCDSSSQGLLVHKGLLMHKEALFFAMGRLREDCPWISIDADRATAQEISPETLLSFPDTPWKESAHGTTRYLVDFPHGGAIPYWYAFLEPPHGTGPVTRDGKTVRSEYGKEDFDALNSALFPKGTDELQVFEWSTDWSSYFDAGREWWGTLCCTVYDRKMNRYAVIMASSTD